MGKKTIQITTKYRSLYKNNTNNNKPIKTDVKNKHHNTYNKPIERRRKIKTKNKHNTQNKKQTKNTQQNKTTQHKSYKDIEKQHQQNKTYTNL